MKQMLMVSCPGMSCAACGPCGGIPEVAEVPQLLAHHGLAGGRLVGAGPHVEPAAEAGVRVGVGQMTQHPLLGRLLRGLPFGRLCLLGSLGLATGASL